MFDTDYDVEDLYIVVNMDKKKPNNMECVDDDICLVVGKRGNDQLFLAVAKHACYLDENEWLSADDEGWLGPLRYVVAWCPVKHTAMSS